ncbi:alpha/beta hydrolase [Dyadobacter psychrotolerans]|uniref:Alpha/beta hydrolase n=1 Tax=Dyadobacter psychrotolerans TaxID=2541721 RepID=A0A4V6PFR8_9BACT|nr:alpha/beta fold hydrolase [Dyadobacter psychrotolerans]TDE13808.1 alpha/beta hydrolase [Dyadobacter psychrotolerans]
MLKIILGIAAVVVVVAIIYFVGPSVPAVQFSPVLPSVPQDLSALEQQIDLSEKGIKNLKRNNQARIVWADSTKKAKTPYSIVYIHGFGASWAEGEPIHRDLAKRYGANLYLARMHDAGINDPDAFDDLTPENFMQEAKRALAVGKVLGDSVIVIGTSAGGLLTVYLASTNPEIKGVVLYSPCMAVASPALKLVTGPWGRKILYTIMGEHRKPVDNDPELSNYWLQSYRTNGLLTLQQTIDAIARPEVYKKIKMPLFLGYYFKNEKEQDQTVSVKAMQDMFPLLGTPDNLKVEKAFPESGDHVIGSYLRSKDVKGVYEATDQFFQKKLGLKPVNK